MLSPRAIYTTCVVACLGLTSFVVEASVLAQLGWYCLAIILSNIVYRALLLVLPRPLLPDLNRRAVIITGCDSGFGHALALRLDSLGVPVYAGCLFPDGDGAKSFETSASSRLKVVPLDVTNKESIDKAVDVVRQDLGADNQLWGIVNNAGIAYHAGIEWCSVDMFRQTLDVNVLGVVQVTKAFLPILRANQKGRIIAVASILGRVTMPLCSAYCMSKYAVVSFLSGLRMELRQWGISVHGIEPTLYRTPLTEKRTLEASMQKGWDSASEEVRTSYGETYLRRNKHIMKKFLTVFSRPATEVEDVVDAMVDAVVGAKPQDTYIPGGVISQLHEYLLFAMPQWFQNWALHILYLSAVPAAVNKWKKL